MNQLLDNLADDRARGGYSNEEPVESITKTKVTDADARQVVAHAFGPGAAPSSVIGGQGAR